MEIKAGAGKYRKKLVVVDAAEWLCKGHCPAWAQHAVREENTFFEIATLEGVMRGEPGDWIIRGVHGEIYPCKGDIFAATYEPADAEQPAAQAAGLTDAQILDMASDHFRYAFTGELAVSFARALLSRAEREAAGLRQMLDAERQRAANAVAVSNALQDKLSRAAPQSSEQQADPCPGCVPGGVCKTPTCGRLQAREAERSRGKPVSQLVAECEADPHRKAALDRARERVAEQAIDHRTLMCQHSNDQVCDFCRRRAEQPAIHPEHMALLQSVASPLNGRLPRDVVDYIKKRHGAEGSDRDEIQALIDAAVNLVKVSGRYHSEIAYRRLATAANEYAAACRERMDRVTGERD